MEIRKYLRESIDAARITQDLGSQSGNSVLQAVEMRRQEKVKALLDLPVDLITEKEIASRLGEIRGLKFLSELYEQSRTITEG